MGLLQGFGREKKKRVSENGEKRICEGSCRKKTMIFDAFSEGCVGNLRGQEEIRRE